MNSRENRNKQDIHKIVKNNRGTKSKIRKKFSEPHLEPPQIQINSKILSKSANNQKSYPLIQPDSDGFKLTAIEDKIDPTNDSFNINLNLKNLNIEPNSNSSENVNTHQINQVPNRKKSHFLRRASTIVSDTKFFPENVQSSSDFYTFLNDKRQEIYSILTGYVGKKNDKKYHIHKKIGFLDNDIREMTMRNGSITAKIFDIYRRMVFLNLAVSIIPILLILVPELISSFTNVHYISPQYGSIGSECHLISLLKSVLSLNYQLGVVENIGPVANTNSALIHKYLEWKSSNGMNKNDISVYDFIKSPAFRGEITRTIEELILGGPFLDNSLLFTRNYDGRAFKLTADSKYFIPKKTLFLIGSLLVTIVSIAFGYIELQRKYGLRNQNKRQSISAMIFGGFDLWQTLRKTINQRKELFQDLSLTYLRKVRKLKNNESKIRRRSIRKYCTPIIINRILVWVTVLIVHVYYLAFIIEFRKAYKQQFQDPTSSKRIDIALSVSFSLLFFIFPPLFDYATKFENYNTNTAMNITILRSTSLKLFPIVTLLFPRATDEFDKCQCTQPSHGPVIFKMMLTAVVGEIFEMMFIRPLIIWIGKLCKKDWSMNFNVRSSIINLIFMQTTVVMAIPYMPLASLMGAMYFFIKFQTQQFNLEILKAKPPRNYHNNHEILMLNLMILSLGIGFFYMVQYLLIAHSGYCGLFDFTDGEVNPVKYSKNAGILILEEIGLKWEDIRQCMNVFNHPSLLLVSSCMILLLIYNNITSRLIRKKEKKDLKLVIRQLDMDKLEKTTNEPLEIDIASI